MPVPTRMGRDLSRDTARAVFAENARYSDPTSATGTFPVEPGEMNLFASAVGNEARLSAGPLVEGTLSLRSTRSIGRRYTHGIDYLEVPDGGFENMAIPEGTPLLAEWFYHSDGPILESVGGAAALPASTVDETGSGGGGIFATLLKLGGI